MLQKSDLVPIFRSAFAPLTCVPELQNYDHALGLAVYLPNGSRIVRRWPNATHLLNTNSLQAAVLIVRRAVEASGATLAQWSLPSSK